MSTRDALAAAKALVATVPGWPGREPMLRPGAVPMASPMNQGVDSTGLRAQDPASGESIWVKIAHSDAALFADPTSVVAAARQAGELGVGPEVLAADPRTGDLVMRDLGGSHRVATLNRLAEPAIRDAVLAVKRAFQAGPRLPRTTSVFDHIEALLSRAGEQGVALPADHAWLLDNIRSVARAIRAAGVDTAPAHGDGNASNVMIDAAGGVLLVDFDLAANIDPFEDLGSFLVEAHAFDPAARESFEAFHGRFDERLFNRARLYGVADDLRWGLIGAILAGTSARTDLEFLKYAEWRFLRCRMAMRDQRFEERVRRI